MAAIVLTDAKGKQREYQLEIIVSKVPPTIIRQNLPPF